MAQVRPRFPRSRSLKRISKHMRTNNTKPYERVESTGSEDCVQCTIYCTMYNFVHVLGISFYKFSYGISEYTGAYLKW